MRRVLNISADHGVLVAKFVVQEDVMLNNINLVSPSF